MKRIILGILILAGLFSNLSAYQKCFHIGDNEVCVRDKYELRDKIDETKDQLKQLNMNILDYVADHKIATGCLLATGSTAVSFLNNDQQLQEDENFQNLVAILNSACVVYMIVNMDEIGDVTGQFIKYGTKYYYLQQKLQTLQQELNNW